MISLALLAGFACNAARQDPAPPPNVVLILADDLGWGDLGCYAPDSRIDTPHLDRLASEGTRFTDAHSPSSVCTPTRYGILTGRCAWRRGLERSVLWSWDPPLIEPERTTLPELLAARGYATACIGKWHLGWDWPLSSGAYVTDVFDGISLSKERRAEIGELVVFDRPLRGGPLAHGFERYFGDDVPNFPPYTWITDDRVDLSPTAKKPSGMFGHPGPLAPGWDLSLVMPVLTQRAAAWIEQRAATPDEPFFLFWSLTAPHTPIAPTPRFAGSSEAGAYGDFVTEIDWAVGEVLAALERSGAAANTLVLFTSDNGSPARNGQGMSGPIGSVEADHGHDPSGPWRGMKSDAWEGGHRVPLLARWPEEVPAERVSDAPIVLTDLYRSVATLSGAAVPDGNGEDSFDQSAELRGGAPAPIRDHLIHHSGNGVYAIREGAWKLILGRGSGGFTRWTPPVDAPAGQLYHLGADPAEASNVYAEEPDVVARLTARLAALRAAGSSVAADED